MDPITTAVIAALSAGVAAGLTETSKTVISDAYAHLKDLLVRKFGVDSDVMQAIDRLEAKPDAVGRRQVLEGEIAENNVQQDREILAAAQQVLTLLHSRQIGRGKFTIQNNAPVQGQIIGDSQQITQHFGPLPKG